MILGDGRGHALRGVVFIAASRHEAQLDGASTDQHHALGVQFPVADVVVEQRGIQS